MFFLSTCLMALGTVHDQIKHEKIFLDLLDMRLRNLHRGFASFFDIDNCLQTFNDRFGIHVIKLQISCISTDWTMNTSACIRSDRLLGIKNILRNIGNTKNISPIKTDGKNSLPRYNKIPQERILCRNIFKNQRKTPCPQNRGVSQALLRIKNGAIRFFHVKNRP